MNKVAINQLDKQLDQIKCVATLARPIYGWIKTIRSVIGMTSKQFAKRLGIAQSRVSAIERGEIEDALTLKTLREAAGALNCRLVYFLVPEKTLKEMVQEQVVKFVKSETQGVAHSMTLEDQGVDDFAEFIQAQVEDVLAKKSNKIWEVE
ncbi:MAG: mobile mystery protein A [Holosporales bacterium]|nr:mobile mystery protein A [Holosporales bacterium]